MNNLKDRTQKRPVSSPLSPLPSPRLQIQNGLQAFSQTLNLPNPSALPHSPLLAEAERGETPPPPPHPSRGDVDGGVYGVPRVPGPHVLGGGGGEGGQEVRGGGRETQGGQEAGGSEQSPRDHAAGAGLRRPAQVRRRRSHLPLRRPQDRLGLHQGQRPPGLNKREIICDEKLKSIFPGRDTAHMMEVTKLLSPHFVKTT